MQLEEYFTATSPMFFIMQYHEEKYIDFSIKWSALLTESKLRYENKYST